MARGQGTREAMWFRTMLSAVGIVGLGVIAAAGQTAGPRVYVTDSEFWESRGGVLLLDDGIGGSAGGARPQTAEVMKTFGESCPTVRVNRDPEKAEFVVIPDHEEGKPFFQRDN
jgi:hypothetical protein